MRWTPDGHIQAEQIVIQHIQRHVDQKDHKRTLHQQETAAIDRLASHCLKYDQPDRDRIANHVEPVRWLQGAKHIAKVPRDIPARPSMLEEKCDLRP